jgi:hypothetical protein
MFLVRRFRCILTTPTRFAYRPEYFPWGRAFAVQVVAPPRGGDGPAPHAGNSTMPRPASATFAFEAEHIEAMRKAFDTACARLELSTGTGDQKTEFVARRIIELASAGERDADRLAARTLAEFGVGNDGSSWRH